MAINRVTLTINSRQYTVVADESEEYIEKLCNHINEKVAEVIKGGQNILGERPVVLAALNICDEYFKALDDSISRAELNIAKSNLEIAQRKIRQLEGQVKDLENRLRSHQNQGRKSR